MKKVNTDGLSRGEVLAALFNEAKPQGLGMLHFCPRKMNPDEGEHMFLQGDYFDYLEGRVIKTEIKRGQDWIDATLYDRDNGDGAAQRAVENLRAEKDGRSPNAGVPLVFMKADRKPFDRPGIKGFKFDVMGGTLAVFEEHQLAYPMSQVVFEFCVKDPRRQEFTTGRYVCYDTSEPLKHFGDIACRVIFEVVRKLSES